MWKIFFRREKGEREGEEGEGEIGMKRREEEEEEEGGEGGCAIRIIGREVVRLCRAVAWARARGEWLAGVWVMIRAGDVFVLGGER